MAALPLLAACTDRTLTLPANRQPAPEPLAGAQCRVNVTEQSMVCTDAYKPAGSAVRGDKILGRQEVYVRLASYGTSFDSGTNILSSNVTVQNLLRMSMGTEDGVTMKPVQVFFTVEPTVTVGTGSVTINNADSLGTFTASNQPCFGYNQIITPYQVSNPRNWQFLISGSVTTFVFTVYVSAPLTNYAGPFLDEVWTGTTSTNWQTAGNWSTAVVPDSASTVSIPADSLLASPNMPVLSADGQLTNLRVGYASTLGLGGFTLTAWGNVDATGTIGNGTLWMRGTGALLDGSVGSLKVSGSTFLQSAVKTTGAVSVSGGTLTTNGNALSIQIP